jgi:hypothetical protein
MFCFFIYYNSRDPCQQICDFLTVQRYETVLHLECCKVVRYSGPADPPEGYECNLTIFMKSKHFYSVE